MRFWNTSKSANRWRVSVISLDLCDIKDVTRSYSEFLIILGWSASCIPSYSISMDPGWDWEPKMIVRLLIQRLTSRETTKRFDSVSHILYPFLWDGYPIMRSSLARRSIFLTLNFGTMYQNVYPNTRVWDKSVFEPYQMRYGVVFGGSSREGTRFQMYTVLLMASRFFRLIFHRA